MKTTINETNLFIYQDALISNLDSFYNLPNGEIVDMDNKKARGQYFTTSNPFKTKAFIEWINLIPNFDKETIIEPFAGSNNIPYMLGTENGFDNEWDCYDIEPNPNNKCPEYFISERDSLNNFPKGYNVAITNPPYLSKSSAARKGLEFPETKYDDIYKMSLDVMLKNCDYVAAIIPETFITSGLFHNRLFAVVSLTCKMFSDTECPVCLALFVPEHNDSFLIYRMNELIGDYNSLKENEIKCQSDIKWTFNDANGEIGIYCLDNTKSASIRFGKGIDIPSETVKSTSRSITRVSGIPEDINLEDLINECNLILEKHREETKDVLLAPFKGLRKDGCYRRRLDFATARNIMNQALVNLEKH